MPPIARTRGWPAAVAWLAAVLLLVALGDRLVRACAVGALDWPAAIRALLPDTCPAPAAGDAPDAATLALITGAEADLRGREIDSMRRALACAASCSPVSPIPERRAEIPAPVTADMERRLERVERGRGLELTLAWEGAADLDLHVSCPGGDRIAFDRREACGARLVADLNASGGSPDGSLVVAGGLDAKYETRQDVGVYLFDSATGMSVEELAEVEGVRSRQELPETPALPVRGTRDHRVKVTDFSVGRVSDAPPELPDPAKPGNPRTNSPAGRLKPQSAEWLRSWRREREGGGEIVPKDPIRMIPRG